MARFKVFVKPTSGGEKLSVEVEDVMTVSELKEALSAPASTPSGEQRLIYKGQVLKNERTVDSYGIKAEHVLHLVRSKPPVTSASDQPAQPATTEATPGAPLFGLGAQPPSSGQQQMLSSLLNMPQVQSMLQNPEVLRTMLNSNPAIRQLMSSNPEMAHVLNNPQLLRESLNLAANPSLLREQMRHSDRAMSNLEAHPEGFNALRRMYENIHEPLQNAAQGEQLSSANPFAALLQNQPGQQPANQTEASAEAGADPEGNASSAPNTAPLPNPWAPNAGSGAAAAGSRAVDPALDIPPDFAGADGTAMFGRAAPPGFPHPGSAAASNGMLQMLQDPTYRQAMSDFMASDFGQQTFRDMLDSTPQLQLLMERNPEIRAIFTDPERISRALSQESIQALAGLRQHMNQLRQAGAAQPGGDRTANTAAVPDYDLGTLASVLGLDPSGRGGALSGGVPPVGNPEEAYANQLAQLQEMGFFDTQANIRALQSTGGNVQAAVDRLLQHL